MVTIQGIARYLIENWIDARKRLPPEAVDKLGCIFSQLGSAPDLEHLLLLKKKFIGTLGIYSVKKFKDVPQI